jgi:hypothetical protein
MEKKLGVTVPVLFILKGNSTLQLIDHVWSLLQQRGISTNFRFLTFSGTQPSTIEQFPEIIHIEEDRYKPFPLNDLQQTYWIGRSAQFELGHVSCHFYFEYENNYNLEKLNEAFCAVVEQNDILRAVVLSTGKLKVLEKVKKYVIEEEDLTSFNSQDVEEHLLHKRQKLAHSGFNPEKWPMFDIKASKLIRGNYR